MFLFKYNGEGSIIFMYNQNVLQLYIKTISVICFRLILTWEPVISF